MSKDKIFFEEIIQLFNPLSGHFNIRKREDEIKTFNKLSSKITNFKRGIITEDNFLLRFHVVFGISLLSSLSFLKSYKKKI